MDAVTMINASTCAVMIALAWQLRRAVAQGQQSQRIAEYQQRMLQAEIQSLSRSFRNTEVITELPPKKKRSEYEADRIRRRWKARSQTVAKMRCYVARLTMQELEQWSRLVFDPGSEHYFEVERLAIEMHRKGRYIAAIGDRYYLCHKSAFIHESAWSHICGQMAARRLGRARQAQEIQARWDQRRMERATAPAVGLTRRGARL